MYKRLLPIIFVLIILSSKAIAQIDSNKVAKNAFFVEIAGIGGYGSINYERIIIKLHNLYFCTRFGISTYNLTDFTNKFNPDIIIPLAINGLYGKTHKLEFSFGQTISNIIYVDNSSFNPKRKTNLHSNFSIGYRYQKENGGLVFRCNYSPICEFYKYFRHWGGISIGYSF